MMVNRLSAAEATQSLHQALKTYQQPALLVVDEIAERAEVFHLEGTSYREKPRASRPAPKGTSP